jgi:hypothetical protein
MGPDFWGRGKAGGKSNMLMGNRQRAVSPALSSGHSREGGNPALASLSAGSPPSRGRQVVSHRPYSLRPRAGRRLRPVSGALSRAPRSRGDGAPIGASCSKVRTFIAEGATPLGAPPGQLGPGLFGGFSVPGTVTSGRATEDFSSRASARLRPHRVQPSKAAGRRAGGRLPRASRVRGYEPRPQAPHPTPLSERLMTTPSSGWDEVGI